MKELNEGEVICPDCNGVGVKDYKIGEYYDFRMCPRCLGTGKLDWLELIVGKKQDYIMSLYNYQVKILKNRESTIGIEPVFKLDYTRKLKD